MTRPHVHAEYIKAWADGKPLQYKRRSQTEWTDVSEHMFCWEEAIEVRIKPEPKQDIAKLFVLEAHPVLGLRFADCTGLMLLEENQYIEAVFDGETNKIKNVRVVV